MNTRFDKARDILWNALETCTLNNTLLDEEKKIIQEDVEELFKESLSMEIEEQYGQRPMSEGAFEHFLDEVRSSGFKVN